MTSDSVVDGLYNRYQNTLVLVVCVHLALWLCSDAGGVGRGRGRGRFHGECEGEMRVAV